GWLGVPLLFGEQLIGILTLDQLEMISTLPNTPIWRKASPQAATAIENVRACWKPKKCAPTSETLRSAALAPWQYLEFAGRL
ncbi:hypothetical protein, partial [Candidatus Villigracilis saccharophilus]|uniref:hypothetical protein n=1 Tax=Candidatus Villigracilis saccharophilus TaxID=3140684 RepID=UPI0031E736CC